MSSTVIQVDNVWKKYRLGVLGTGTLRHDLNRWWHRVRGRHDPYAMVGQGESQESPSTQSTTMSAGALNDDEIWALQGISFEVRQGEIIGIIGRNGAGKSTLLKILSRVTAPTSGEVRVKGRIASLLEVGTGFHPELTGKENIFLNGAILGMRKAEIQKKLDEIVAFSGVERYIDTPVKRYSSGMYVRLAFAVAAHLEPEILIVDEVLAVGDVEFQRKCIGKMEDISRSEGRTVIFVSHNMAMISNLCQKGIALKSGQILFQGMASEAVLMYYKNLKRVDGDAEQSEREFESNTAKLLGVELVGVGNALETTIHADFSIRMKYRIKRAMSGKCVPNFHFFSADGSYVFVSGAEDVDVMSPGDYWAECKIPGRLLNEGTYFVGVALTTYSSDRYEVDFFDRNALTFNVIDPMDERSNRYGYGGPVPGVIRPRLDWNIVKVAQ